MQLPEPTLRRLPWYLAYLGLLNQKGVEYISSTKISEELNVDSSQIAKDLSFLNIRGKTRIGYEVKALESKLRDFRSRQPRRGSYPRLRSSALRPADKRRSRHKPGSDRLHHLRSDNTPSRQTPAAGKGTRHHHRHRSRAFRKRPGHGRHIGRRRHTRSLELYALSNPRPRRSRDYQHIHLFTSGADI